MRNIFITGATGFLGSYILRELLRNEEISPIVLVRNKKGESADRRIDRVLRYFYGDKNYKIIARRIRIVEGEVDKRSLGINDKIRESLANEIDEIYHSAAVAQFRMPLAKIRKSNVDGTKNIFDFALECKDKGRLKTVNHISTTYVAGTRSGIFYEHELDVGQGFNNTYEQTKYEAELLVRGYQEKGLPITVFRPSILTGDSVEGKTNNFKMLYQPLHFFSEELFEIAPINRFAKENLIPVDLVAKAIIMISSENKNADKIYHIANTSTVEMGHFIDIAEDFFGFKKPELIPFEYFDMTKLSPVQRKLIEPYIPYFNYKTMFDSSEAQKIIIEKELKYPVIDDRFLERIFKFCAKSGFIKPKKHYVAVE